MPVADNVLYEFATLGLSFMATEYSSKVKIFECGGVEPLVRLLSASDPDVQKNSIEALAQMALVPVFSSQNLQYIYPCMHIL